MKMVKIYWSEEQLKFLHRIIGEKKGRTVSAIANAFDDDERKSLRKEEDRCRRIDSKIAKGLMKMLVDEDTEEVND